MANRRKKVSRNLSLGRLFSRGRNRRVRARADQDQPRQPTDWRSLGRAVGRAGVLAAQAVALAAVLLGTGAGGYLAYDRVMTSPTFLVQRVRVTGAKRAQPAQLRRMARRVLGQHIFSVDLPRARRAVLEHPWVKDARVYREYPNAVGVAVVEQRAKALLLLGHLYLVNVEGRVFKKAETHEADGLPVITGVTRLAYLNRPAAVHPRLRAALAALDRYRRQRRPPLSEINVDHRGEITLFLRRNGVALRFGGDVSDDRLKKLDAVWAALGPDTRRVRAVFLDNETRRDRVTVRLGSY